MKDDNFFTTVPVPPRFQEQLNEYMGKATGLFNTFHDYAKVIITAEVLAQIICQCESPLYKREEILADFNEFARAAFKKWDGDGKPTA
jgi:hypothetical protein